MEELRTVAALCVSGRSIYKQLEGVEVWDMKRDCRTFAGGMPVVCHPPCRSWSAFVSHQAKPPPGEKELGLLCAEWLKRCGGVLEHPAHSRLFAAAGLPMPEAPTAGAFLWTLEVWQCWWGYPMRKATWLCFAGVDPKAVELPFQLHRQGFDHERHQRLSSAARSRTMPEFASWLVGVARQSVPPMCDLV